MLQRIFQHFRSHTKRKQQVSRSSLRLESLESRIVLTTVAPGTAALVGTQLGICGTGAGESILIAELQNNYFVSADFLSEPLFFPKANVSSISITAGGGNDTIVATSMTTPITLSGEGGNDRIFGGESHDIIYGGTGDDLIYGNAGTDTIRAGDGNDRVFAGAGNDRVHGGFGNDTLAGMDGFDELHGNDGADDLAGGAGNDMLFGGADNDLLLGMNGDDQLFAGLGDDRLFGDIEGGVGDDEMHGGGGNDQLFGVGGDDILIGNEGNDLIRGGLGDDVLVGHTGQDEMFGMDGRDILIGGDAADQLDGDIGEDYIICGTTSHQLDPSLLAATRQTWVSLHDSGTAYNAIVSAVASGYTVNDPLDGDTVRGGPQTDAFFCDVDSGIQDLGPIELVVGANSLAVDDTFNLVAGQVSTFTAANGVLANDIAVAAGTAAIITPVTSGTLNFNPDGGFNYSNPVPGNYSFVYGAMPPTQATANLVVNAVANDDSFELGATPFGGTASSVDAATGVLANDITTTGTVAVITPPSSGTLNLNADGSFDYTNSVAGDYTFVYELTTPGLPPVQATATITIGDAVNDSYILTSGQTSNVPVAEGVINNDSVGGTVTLLTPPASGVLVLNADGSFDYTNDAPGFYYFDYELTPTTGATSQATAEIEIKGFPEIPAGSSLTPLPSGTGVEVFDFAVGTGPNPVATSNVDVDYVGYLPNGIVFDSNEGSVFNLGGVIPGFAEGILGMQAGGMRRISIPPAEGYGANGNSNAGIGPNDVIVFDVTLNSFV